jgi:hypothetical protein
MDNFMNTFSAVLFNPWWWRMNTLEGEVRT